MNSLGRLFETSKSTMKTRGHSNERFSSYVQGHSEAASNNLSNLWNSLDQKSVKSLMAAKIACQKH